MADTDAWLLRHLPAGNTLPDLAPESRDFVRRLAAASAHRDATELQIAHDAQRMAARHQAELAEVEDVLQQCGLAPHSLPTAVSSSLGARLARARAGPRSQPAGPSRDRPLATRSCAAQTTSPTCLLADPDACGREQTRYHRLPSRWTRATPLCAAYTAPSRRSRFEMCVFTRTHTHPYIRACVHIHMCAYLHKYGHIRIECA